MSGNAMILPMEQQLLLAVTSDNIPFMHQLLNSIQGDELSAPHILQPSLLKSLETGNLSAMQYLLEHGADPNATCSGGKTLPMTAALNDSLVLLSLLEGKRADANARDDRGRNVLHYLAGEVCKGEGDLHRRHNTIDFLLKQKVDVNAQDKLGRSPLHLACISGNRSFVRQLLDAAVNTFDSGLMTPLYLAAAHAHADVVQLLIERGAEVNVLSIGGWTPLHKACQQGSSSVVKLLLSSGADIRARLADGSTPLHTAAQGGNVEIIESLLASIDSQLTVRDVYGNTAFLRAAQNRQLAAMNIFSPSNSQNLTKLSSYARAACEKLYATVVDFDGTHTASLKHQTEKVAIYDLLYSDSNIMPQKRETVADLLPGKDLTNFRWIHLPANNLEWFEALFAKQLNESNGDFSGLDSLINAVSSQNRGNFSSLCSMKPSCYVGNGGSLLATEFSKSSYIVLPYIQFETLQDHQAMANTIRQVQVPDSRSRPPVTPNETFIRAYLSPNASEYARRTLDQSCLHIFDTSFRRRSREVASEKLSGYINSKAKKAKVMVIDQLWMWMLGDDLIVTAFPGQWQLGDDAKSVLHDIFADIESNDLSPSSIYDLSDCIISKCCGIFDPPNTSKSAAQFLDKLDTTVSGVVEQEKRLYTAFNKASLQASAWLRNHRRSGREVKETFSIDVSLDNNGGTVSDGVVFVDNLLDQSSEMALYIGAGEIKDEVGMLEKVLRDQLQVLSDFRKGKDSCQSSTTQSHLLVPKNRIQLHRELENINSRVLLLAELWSKMEHVSNSVGKLLDMKEKQAGAFEARFARDQANYIAEAGDQGTSIFIFTIATIFFLPMSFISSFFTINIKEFPKDSSGNTALPLGFVLKYVFGIGLGISLLLVIVALCTGLWADFWRRLFWALGRFRRRRQFRREDIVETAMLRTDAFSTRSDLEVDVEERPDGDLVWNRSLTNIAGRPREGEGGVFTLTRRMTSEAERGL